MDWISKLARRGPLPQDLRSEDTSQTSEEHLTYRCLRPGSFYWVILTLNPDADLWVNDRMPARFAGYVGGVPTWNFLGGAAVFDWPVGWVGPEIVP
jgi:hypothetical protein